MYTYSEFTKIMVSTDINNNCYFERTLLRKSISKRVLFALFIMWANDRLWEVLSGFSLIGFLH